MARINENFKKIQGSYLFSTIAKKVEAYKALHPEERVISLGIGDVTQPIAPTIIKDIYARIVELNKNGLSVVLVEQDVQRSKKTSEYCYIMLKGKVVLSGRSKELSDEAIKNAYFGI